MALSVILHHIECFSEFTSVFDMSCMEVDEDVAAEATSSSQSVAVESSSQAAGNVGNVAAPTSPPPPPPSQPSSGQYISPAFMLIR